MTIGFESRKDSCTHFGKGSIFEDISCMTCHDCNECNELNNKRKKERYLSIYKECRRCNSYDRYECKGAPLCFGHVELCSKKYCQCMNHCIDNSDEKDIQEYLCKRSIRSQYGDVYEKGHRYVILSTEYAYYVRLEYGWSKMFESYTIFEDYFEEIK